MEYAIISIKNNQYLVKPGDKITTLGVLGEPGTTYSDCKTLLYKDGSLHVGMPELEKQISLKIVEISKTPKVDIFKYKSKSRYRRHTGHRQAMTILEVVGKDQNTGKKEQKAKPEKKTATAKSATPTKKSTTKSAKKTAVKK